MMEETNQSEKSEKKYQSTECHVRKDLNPYQYRCDSLKSPSDINCYYVP